MKPSHPLNLFNLTPPYKTHCHLGNLETPYWAEQQDKDSMELAVYINTLSWDRLTICYNDDDDKDCTIAIIPILSIEDLDNSLSMGDEHLDTVSVTKSDELIKSSVEKLVPIPSESEEYVEASPPDSELISSEVMEIVIPEVGRIDDDILLTIIDDILHEKLLNINLLIANIEALKDNSTSYYNFMTKSSFTYLNFLLEETNTFDNSLPKSKTFCFDLEEISSGSTTTRSNISLPDYEAFYDDHVKEISSGSTTIPFDSVLYDSFIFDLSINPFPPAGRSDFDEFVDELAHIISPPEIAMVAMGGGKVNKLRGWWQKPGHLSARLGCAETKVITWDDLASKLITLGWNVKHKLFYKNVDPRLKFESSTFTLMNNWIKKFTTYMYEYQHDKDSRVGIDWIGGQGKWRVKMDDLSSLTR
nr:hypothetical protein [Tanacetum cinerariifolium]